MSLVWIVRFIFLMVYEQGNHIISLLQRSNPRQSLGKDLTSEKKTYNMKPSNLKSVYPSFLVNFALNFNMDKSIQIITVQPNEFSQSKPTRAIPPRSRNKARPAP